MSHRIAIVEDDEDIRELAIYALEADGFVCSGFESGDAFFSEINEGASLPSLVLLDIMLPGSDGLSVLKRLRALSRTARLPVIMLTAKGGEADRVKGLDLGADDYIPKPFGVTELKARIRAVLRRAEISEPKETTCANITLDEERRLVLSDGREVELTFKEFELLRHLMLNPNIAMSREKLMDAVWGYDYEGETRTVDMHVKTLRKKLGAAGEQIRTVRNVGYKIEA